jgi:aminomethyltransferase
MASQTPLKRTPLHALHIELGARMVPFAGYDMPVQYPSGILTEHLHCRSNAALFDVSHMGQVHLHGAAADTWLESLVPADVVGLPIGRQRYAVFTNETGGILDDLMVSRAGTDIALVVNAANKAADVALLMAAADGRCEVSVRDDLALLALQGPAAESALCELASSPADVCAMRFMDARSVELAGLACTVTRSGYTGEDGFEISVPAHGADAFARALVALAQVEMAGLGARDSLRLEAGMPLHGHDISPSTSPVAAGLSFAIGKARRPGGAREGGYPGALQLNGELAARLPVRRVGLRPSGRAPIREGAAVLDSQGTDIGRVTSGGFGPSAGGPVVMAWLNDDVAHDRVAACEVRGKALPVGIASMPFVVNQYRR